jgi:hypothetical protein
MQVIGLDVKEIKKAEDTIQKEIQKALSASDKARKSGDLVKAAEHVARAAGMADAKNIFQGIIPNTTRYYK